MGILLAVAVGVCVLVEAVGGAVTESEQFGLVCDVGALSAVKMSLSSPIGSYCRLCSTVNGRHASHRHP